MDAAQTTLARLRAGRGVTLDLHKDHVVVVHGPLYPEDGAPAPMIVENIADLFDVALRGPSSDGTLIEETYPGVTIGLGTEAQRAWPDRSTPGHRNWCSRWSQIRGLR